MTPQQSYTLHTNVLAATSFVSVSALGDAGRWRDLALAFEDAAGAGSTASATKTGYMLRCALALEAIEGTSPFGINNDEAGYLLRICNAMESSTAVTTGSVAGRIVLASATWTAAPAETFRFDLEANNDSLLLESGGYLLLEAA